MLSTSNTTCSLKTSATVCGTLMAAPVAGCLYGQAIRLTAVPLQRSVYHSRLDARNRSYPPTPEPNDTLVGLRRSLAGVVRHADRPLYKVRRARVTFSKISEARAVQMKGLGFSLWRSM